MENASYCNLEAIGSNHITIFRKRKNYPSKFISLRILCWNPFTMDNFMQTNGLNKHIDDIMTVFKTIQIF